MECFTSGYNIINDNNNRLRNSIEFLSAGNNKKAIILAGYINSQEFLDYCKQFDSFDSSKSLADNNQNTVRSILRKYYRERHKSVIETAAKEQAEALQGFSSVNAKNLAIDYTAVMINITYNVHRMTSGDRKLDRKAIINEVYKKLEDDFNSNCVITLYKKLRPDREFKANKVLDDYREANNNFIDISNQLRKARKSANPDKEVIKQLEEQFAEAKRIRFNTSCLVVAKYGSVVEKNQMNMIVRMKANPNEWFTTAFQSSRLVAIVNEFEGTLESDKLINENFEDDNDYTNPDAYNVDESSKSWEDKNWASFEKAINTDLKLYFNTLFKLASKGTVGDEHYNYDTDNEMGVPTTMGAKFVIGQLMNYTNGYSVNDFINSVINCSQQIPECYGFIAIANRMLKDPVFANRVFTQISNAKMIKSIIILGENGIDVMQSNRSVDALSYMVFDMLNNIRSSMTSLYEETDYNTLVDLLNRITKRSNEFLIKEYDINDEKNYNQLKIDEKIYDILKKYYPNLNYVALKSYITSNPNNIKSNLINLLNSSIELVTNIGRVIDSYNKEIKNNNDAYKEWRKKRNMADLTGVNFTEERPVLNLDHIDYSSLNSPIISIAKMLVNFSAVKNDLNSVNAEGNLSSDIIANSYITNILKQIAYSNQEDANAGLNKLLNEITKGEQYKYNTLFWGVTDRNGNIIKQGIFNRDKQGNITINKDARKIIQISLFNGIKNYDNSKSVLYNRMSKADYLMANLNMFFQPMKIGEHIGTSTNILNEQFGGYFMRTPSDAPKNFIVQTYKYSTKGILIPNTTSSNLYVDEEFNIIDKTSFKETPNNDTYDDWFDDYNGGVSKATKKNVWKPADIYNIIFNGNKNIPINYNGMFAWNDSNGNTILPIIYKNGEDVDIIFIKGEKVVGQSNNLLGNWSIITAKSTNNNKFSDSFKGAIRELIINKGIADGHIDIEVNKTVPIFAALRQNLLGEINIFIDQLNNVFQRSNSTGNWTVKKELTGLIDRAHYNGDSIVTFNENTNRYELSGNFFNFKRLFNVNGIDFSQRIIDALSLYGEADTSLIHLTKKTGRLNLNNSIIAIKDRRITLNITNELNNIIDNIVEEWIKNYNREISNRYNQHFDLLQTNGYNIEQLIDCALNYANVSVAFDDIFEGDVKFYKDGQDFLKRAKEVQAAGTCYAGFDINDDLSMPIKDITNRNGEVQPIMIGNISIADFANSYSPVEGTLMNNPASANARNGFRAITIYNTVRPSKYAKRIQQEVFDILKNQMSKEEATKIAFQIYKGFADNTKTNDAQSYITIEEFIRRRYADGTLNDYKDILQQIYEVRTGQRNINDLDIAKINARIQVQKNFYFDKQFDDTTRTYYPRQIKNAEFVLIPELLEGTQLKELYDIMSKYDIGQVNTAETSKAAKKNILTFWDNDGNINPNFESDIIANNNAAIENFYYRFLYKQQNVQEHMKDETNKAGIQLMKKIIDNANENVSEEIKKLFDNYCANIKADFNRLMFAMGWKQNKDGTITNIDDNKQQLDLTEFYKRARHEAQRLGLDENFIDYLIPDNFGNPRMPNYMNNVSSKLESIAQAIFNSAITRQKLPGWHAAQVTQIGHGMKVLDANGKLRELKYHPAIITHKETGEQIEEEDYNKLSDKDKNNYTIKQESYAEVLIPRWSNLIPKDITLEELEREGIDLQIAYRIPTEGKQSVSVIKVVGFLDDVYGSTIMLPDEWVTQTGADFDVDSVYGICHELYVDKKDKRVHKWTESRVKSDTYKYGTYIKEFIESKIPSDIEDPLHENKYRKLKDRLTKAMKERQYDELNRIGKEAGLLTFNEFKNLPAVEQLPRKVRNNNILDAMLAIMQSDNSREENYSRSNFDGVVDAMKEMNTARGASKVSRSTYNIFDQIDFMENAMSGASLKAFSVTRDTFNSVNNRCKSFLTGDNGITIEYDLTDKDINGNNRYYVDTIINAYGIYDKKGSKGNVIVFDKDNNPILIKTNETEEQYKNRLRKQGVRARVRHNRLANSNNNRNVVGQLITVYSSQTTAHILDAIKEGAIFNENTYTFGTFKTMIDVGIDYRTAIAFLMQPSITKIVEAHNEINSIYSNTIGNPIKTAIKRIAAEAGITIKGMPITDYTDYYDVIQALSSNKDIQRVAYELFGATISEEIPIVELSVALDATKLKRRLEQAEITNNSTLSQEEKQLRDIVFDIAMVFTFEKIYNTTKNIEKIMRCCNPDRFGAKQTIRNTRMIINNIAELGFNDDNPNKIGDTIFTAKGNLLEAIYPGFVTTINNDKTYEFGEIDIQNSLYPYLASFLQYATMPSIQINSTIFPTENEIYNNVTDAVQRKLGIIFTDEQYKEYKQYMMSMIYASVPYINTPLTIDKEGWIDEDDNRTISATENNTNYWNAEVSRIFGYEETTKGNVEIQDIYNPTKEELAEFNKLTPAQKVIWIQYHLNENKGIFDFLNVNKFNQWEYKNKGYTHQSIRFTDSFDNMSQTYLAFNQSFYNTSPIIRSATLDLIKYAFIVEGFKFKRGGLSKIITNNALYKNIEDMGTSIVPMIRRVFQYYSNPADATTIRFMTRFIRSHSEYAKLLKLDRSEFRNGNGNLRYKFDTCLQTDNLVFIPYSDKYSDLLEAINAPQSINEDYKVQEYIKVRKKLSGNNYSYTLYRILKRNNGVYLIPLNLLERNETGEYSVNPNNNKFPEFEYYYNLIQQAEDNSVSVKELVKNENGKYTDILPNRNDNMIPKFKFTRVKESLENPDEFKNTSINGSDKIKAEVNNVFAQIEEYVNMPVTIRPTSFLVWSNSKYILSQIPKGMSIVQNILVNSEYIPFEIKRAKQPKGFEESIRLRNKLANIPSSQKIAYERAYNANAWVSNIPMYFEVSPFIDKSAKDKIEQQDKETADENATEMAAITTDASDFYMEESDKFDIIDDTSIALINALSRAERNGDENAAQIKQILEKKGINQYRHKDIEDNRKNIYELMAQYIELAANALDFSLNNYTINGTTYNLGQDELYEALRENKDNVEPIIKLMLNAITFGQNFGQIMTLPLDGLDENTANAIRKIRNNINKIRNNSILKQAFNKMFNNYIANEYSTNPNVRLGIVNLSDTFGNAGWWESWIGDTAMIGNKEIQTVVKIVNGIMSQAIIEDAPKRKRDFYNRLDAILDEAGEFDWEHVIDRNGMRLIRPYTEEFIKEKEQLKEAVTIARESYGIDSIEYIEAKLARDEWYAKNTHQIVAQDYYFRKNQLIRTILKNAPKEYVEYMKLIHELYNDNRPVGILTKEERDRRKTIKRKIAMLTSEYKDSDTLKSDDERFRALQLKNFINAKQSLEEEYFDWNEKYGFKEALKNNLAIIQKYEQEHPNQTLDERLENDTYRDAYEWVHDNSYYVISKEAQKQIDDAFAILKDKDNIKSQRIKKILDDADAYDEFGNIDARKLSSEDLAEIRELVKHKYDFSYDSNAGEAILIKDIPAGLPVLKDEFYRMLRDPSENEKEVNPRRLEIIARINELLGKCIGEDGRIHAKNIFEQLTEEEIKELANNYTKLKKIKSKRKPKEIRERFKNEVEFKTNDTAFNEELAWALTNLSKHSNKFDLFIQIFAQTDSNGEIQLDDNGNYAPNTDIYGYIEPKDKTYIDIEKTEARNFIDENLEFVPTEYYYASMREATDFNSWFRDNHTYNPYTHRWEPLRVWTTMKIKPGSKLEGQYRYVPTNENQEKTVKDGMEDIEYNAYTHNYNIETGEYNNSVRLTSKEHKVQELLEETMRFFAKYNNSNKSFIEQGFIPRKRKLEPDTKWYVQQVFGTLGLEYRNDSEDRYYEKIDYATDREVENTMLAFLKGKGYQEYERIRPRGIRETAEEYEEYLKAVKERNSEIRANNLKIDNALLDDDFRTVFGEAIEQQVINNAKSKAKNWLYLLQEELKQNEAYSVSSLTGKLKINRSESTDARDRFYTTPQNRALESVEAFTRRVIYSQFKRKTPLNKYADLARNITSAKYMIFNLTGGIANIGTGIANIMAEAFAGDSFTKKDIKDGIWTYLSNSIAMIKDMYKDTSDNLDVAISKYFNIVDPDAVTERVAGETAGEYVRRIRNLLYSFQSGGEHFMQNAVLFAVLKGSRIFDDVDGTKRVGTFQNYTWKVEYDTLLSVIGNDENLMDNFREFKRNIRRDKQEAYKYDTFRYNLVEDFLRAFCNKEQINKYIEARKTAIDEAKEKWNKLPIAYEQLTLGKDGYITIKEGSEMTQDMLNQLKNIVFNLNKKIHGVYDKIGAARIEFYWWGGLVMQYHKHIYPGFMKRFRNKGYYNEQTNTIEMGSYTALVRLLGREFRGLSNRIKARSESQQIEVINSIIETGKTALECILNIKTNWNIMPQWERNAVKRCLGDVYGIVSAMLMAMAIYAMTDDDDEEESEFVATALYLSDRLLSESQIYTPWGLFSEASTLWSSPIAGLSGPEDVLKGLSYIAQWAIDDDFDWEYQTGLYRGENKAWVLLKRNIPIYRIVNRLSTMTKNNSYYRINEKALNMRIAKNIADTINPD